MNCDVVKTLKHSNYCDSLAVAEVSEVSAAGASWDVSMSGFFGALGAGCSSTGALVGCVSQLR